MAAKINLKKNFMAPFYGWGLTASRLEPLQAGNLLFTTTNSCDSFDKSLKQNKKKIPSWESFSKCLKSKFPQTFLLFMVIYENKQHFIKNINL